MDLKEGLILNIKDVAAFGPSVVLRHLGRLNSRKTIQVSVPGVGPIYIRPGESDFAAIRQVFGQGQYDISWPPQLKERVRARYNKIVSDGGKPIIVDAGANIGAASLFFGQKYPKGAIVSIEPDAGNAAILKKNLEGRPNYVIMEAAIGSEPGFVDLVVDSDGWGVQTRRSDSGIAVITVEDAYAASGGNVPFIVKIDIEGFEKDLFSSNTGWVDRCHVVFIELHDWMLPGEKTSGSLQKVMGTQDFELFVIGENLVYVRV